MRQIVLMLTLLFAMTKQASATGYIIHINVNGLPGESRMLLKDFESNTDINETVLKDGKGTLQGTLVNGPRLLFVTILAGNTPYWCNFMIDNEEVRLNASITDFPYKVKLTGSPTQDIFFSLNTALAPDRILREGLLTRAKQIMTDASLKSELLQLVRKMAVIDSTEIVIKKSFVENNLQTYPAVLELFLLKSSYEKSELASLYLQLQQHLKESPYGNKIRNFLGIDKIVAKGDKAYAFTAIDKDGNNYSFPQANGKYQLLDFTKNHCAPCVQSVAELKAIQAKYNKLLTITSFSPDEKQAWLQALNRDQPTWLYVRDDKGSAGPVIMNYGVEAYPTFVLINPDGIVVAKWSGYSVNGIMELIVPLLGIK